MVDVGDQYNRSSMVGGLYPDLRRRKSATIGGEGVRRTIYRYQPPSLANDRFSPLFVGFVFADCRCRSLPTAQSRAIFGDRVGD